MMKKKKKKKKVQLTKIKTWSQFWSMLEGTSWFVFASLTQVLDHLLSLRGKLSVCLFAKQNKANHFSLKLSGKLDDASGPLSRAWKEADHRTALEKENCPFEVA